jgi:hypothetical protein
MRVNRRRCRSQRGILLVDLLVTLVVASCFLGSLLQGVFGLHNCIRGWDRSLRMRQALMVAHFQLSRDLRMAGCNPWEAAGVVALETGRSEYAFTVRTDKRGIDPESWPDGDVNDPEERIEYRWGPGESVLRRNGQPVLLSLGENPWDIPWFQVERGEEHGLGRILVQLNEQGDARSFSMGVCIRNRL